jgi:hypothetical protein
MEPIPFSAITSSRNSSSRIATVTAQNRLPGSMVPYEDFDDDCLDDLADSFLPLASAEPLVDLTDDFFSTNDVSSTPFVSHDVFPPSI